MANFAHHILLGAGLLMCLLSAGHLYFSSLIGSMEKLETKHSLSMETLDKLQGSIGQMREEHAAFLRAIQVGKSSQERNAASQPETQLDLKAPKPSVKVPTLKASAEDGSRQHSRPLVQALDCAQASKSPGFRNIRTTQKFYMSIFASGDIVSDGLRKQAWWEFTDVKSLGHGMPMPEAGVMLDIGGNLGYWSLSFANAGFQVITIEAMTRNRQAIQSSLCLNPHLQDRLTLVPRAVSSTHFKDSYRCRVQSTSSLQNKGNGFLRCRDKMEFKSCEQDGQSSSDCEEVPVDTLDNVLEQLNPPRIDFVKIDIEGSECPALEGGMSLISKYRPKFIYIEILYMKKNCMLDIIKKHNYREHWTNGGDAIYVPN